MSQAPTPLRIGILGAGALGSLFAHRLASRTSSEVRLLARTPRPAWVEVDGEGGVAVTIEGPPRRPVDLLLVLVKAYATADAIDWAREAVGEETVALTLQNGIGNAEAIARLLPPERILAGTTAQGASLVAPGLVRHGGSGPTYLAPWAPGGPAEARAGAVADLLRQAGIGTEVVADPLPLLWMKLAVNCGINALTAILQVPNGELLLRPDARKTLEAAAAEVGAVARAAGIRLPADPVERTVAVARATAGNRSSMLQDITAGRRTEIDAINGAVVARGAELGVETPVNAVLTQLVRGLGELAVK